MNCQGCHATAAPDGKLIELREATATLNGQPQQVRLCRRCYITALGAAYPLPWSDARVAQVEAAPTAPVTGSP
jgi:hypothetical protein